MSTAADVRLAALRDNDYAEYVRLAAEAKDERLNELLAKTNYIIAEVGAKARPPARPAACPPAEECENLNYKHS